MSYDGQQPMYNDDGATASPAGKDGKGKRGTGNHSISPVTVKQLGQALPFGENSFRLDNFELNMITLVGAVVKDNKQATHWEYTIDDGTGMIAAKIFVETDDPQSNHIANQMRNVVPGTYVRVVGRLQSFHNEKSLIAYKIMPITDFNEVTFHHLEVIHVHVSRVQGHLGAPTHSYNTADNAQYNSTRNYVPPSNDSVQGQFTDVQRAILSILRENQHVQEGVHVPHVLSSLQHTFQRNDILHALDFLMNEGHIYTGMDDNHIKAS